jgi:hypothetical protein
MKRTIKKITVAAALSTLCMAGTAQALQTTPLNINGVGAVSTLDWSPGNSLGVGGTATVTPQGPVTINSFPLYFQASLGNFQDSNSQVIDATGLHSSYEVTIVAGFYETGTLIPGIPSGEGIGGLALFNLDLTRPSYVYIYKDYTPDANNLAGTGFNDGNLVLAGHIIPDLFSSNFQALNSLVSTVPYSNLDSFETDNWNGQKSVDGSGATNVTVKVDAFNQDTLFFLDNIDILSFNVFTNTSNVLPFLQTDPSKSFYDGFNNTTINTSAPGYLGSINGALTNGDLNPTGNIMFQADANSSFIASVPEPTSFVLTGLGLLIAGGFMRRRRNC